MSVAVCHSGAFLPSAHWWAELPVGEIWPLRLKVPGFQGNESFAVLPGLRQVAKQRLTEFIVAAPADWMRR
jgi:hypothetical protein